MSQTIKRDADKALRRKNQLERAGQESRGSLYTLCAFHPTEKITNFCTNKQCLLPLCPKCIKIHADQHLKMGIFGEFNTIQEAYDQAQQGLKSTVLKLGQLQKLIIDVKQCYDEKVASERKSIRDAKHLFIEEIERIFDQYEKSVLAYQNIENKIFIDELYNSQELLGHLSENCSKALKRMSVPETIMEGIINYYTQSEQIERIQISAENLHKLFPETLVITYYPTDLDRIESMIKRYLDAGRQNEEIWSQYKLLFKKEQPKRGNQRAAYYKQTRQQNSFSPKQRRTVIKQTIERRESPNPRKEEVVKDKKNNGRISEITSLQANLNLSRFKSPLDNFSLARLRRQKNQLK